MAVLVIAIGLQIMWKMVARPSLEIGAMFIAKRHCSIVFVSGLGGAGSPLMEERIFPLSVLPLHVVMEEDRRQVKAVMRLGRWDWDFARVGYFEGHGCVVGGALSGRQCPLPREAAVKPRDFSVTLNERVQQVLAERMEASLPNGKPINARGLVVMHRGVIVGEAYRPPCKRDTRQHGWSMTKSILPFVVDHMIADGLISLESVVSFPPNGKEKDQRLRVKHLLDMVSGLAWSERYDPFGDPTRMLFASRDVSGFGQARHLEHEPGSHFHYSSYDTNLLAYNLALRLGGACQLLEYLHKHLALQQISLDIETDATGLPVFSSFGWATPLNWAAFGDLMMRSAFVRRIAAEPTQVSLTTGKRTPYAGQFWFPQGESSLVPRDTFLMQGFEFQFVAMIASKELVVVQLAATQGDAVPLYQANYTNTFIHQILRAIESDE